MLFKELKAGNYAYLIQNDRERLAVEQAKVLSVGVPYFDAQGSNPVQKVIDFCISHNGKEETYKIPEILSTTQAGTTILFADRDSFLNELEAMRNQSEDIIQSVEYHRQRKTTIEQALAEYNPAYKEKKDMEDRLGKIENAIAGIEQLLRKSSTSKGYGTE